MISFKQFLKESAPSALGVRSDNGFGVFNGDLLSSPSTNVLHVPNSSAVAGSMGLAIDPTHQTSLDNMLSAAGMDKADYNSQYAAYTDLKSNDNNQQHGNITFRNMTAMFDQLPPGAGNPSLAAEIAQTMSVNGFEVDEIYDFMIKEYQKALNGQQIFMNPYQIVNQIQQQKQGQNDISKNINTFDPLADLKKHKLFAPVEYNEVMGDEVGESGFDGTGTDAIYGS